MTAQELLTHATAFYLKSKDFNGYPGHHIERVHGLSQATIRALFRELIAGGLATVVFGDRHPNPHIRAFADESAEEQLRKLSGAELTHACLYPTPAHMRQRLTSSDYSDRPFTRELALGAGQLEYRCFELLVLEPYRNDPRYKYSNDDIRGQVCVTDKYFESHEMADRDQILLETFGFAYDKESNRAVAAFLIYLSRLSSEHQLIWRAKQLTGDYKLHPDYYRNSILGDWGTGISVCDAICEELRLINTMSELMGRPHLFRDDYTNGKPRGFSLLVRPTQEELNTFVLILDKMLSDNIDKSFFMDEVATEADHERKDGKIEVRQKGTISMLDEWIWTRARPHDKKPFEEMVAAFKKVRSLRQKPAHALKQDVFDQKFFHDQQHLLMGTYKGLQSLRLLFSSHPRVKVAPPEIPEVLVKGRIWTQ